MITSKCSPKQLCKRKEFAATYSQAALARAFGNDCKAVYARTDLLEKRRALLEDWGRVVDML